jgi:hypothetical protein
LAAGLTDTCPSSALTSVTVGISKDFSEDDVSVEGLKGMRTITVLNGNSIEYSNDQLL